MFISDENKKNNIRVDFLSWIQDEYLKRRAKNPGYSIRSFARYLGIVPGTVSHLLSGKRKPSASFVNQLFNKLEVLPEEKGRILESLKNKKDRNLLENTNDYYSISLDSFQVIASWYHYAILEMTEQKDFVNDNKWIAGQLNISVTEVAQAVERLKRLELLQEKQNVLVKTKKFVTNLDKSLTSTAHKQLQRYVLQKALDAIDNTPSEEKDITSITMSIDESKIPEAREMIKNFRRNLCGFLESGKPSRVYNLGIQLYPLQKNKKEKTI